MPTPPYSLWASEPDRRYYAGFTGSSGWVLVAPDGARHLITDGRYATQAAAECAGRAQVHIVDTLATALTTLVPAGRVIEFDQATLTFGFVQQLQRSQPGYYWVPMGDRAASHRACKGEVELEHLRRAALIAEQALDAALREWSRHGTEQDLQRAIERQCLQRGSLRMPFEFIVAQGERSALPHGRASGNQLSGEPLTVDWGAEWQGYFSDQTVTVVPDRAHWNAWWQQVYDVVYAAQQAALATVRAGASARAVDAAARARIAQAGMAEAFVHSTGHGVGLEIHEYPSISRSSDVQLRAGMVITVEPGVYFAGRGGVRLEDTVVVTDTGYARLTTLDKAQPIFLDSYR